MANLLSLSDLNTTINHEPRISDMRIAEALDFKRHRKARELIERNRDELSSYGEIAVEKQSVPHGGATFNVYYLNEGQALVICALSRTPKAAEVRKAIIEVFMAYRRGKLVKLETVESTRKLNSLLAHSQKAVYPAPASLPLLPPSGRKPDFKAMQDYIEDLRAVRNNIALWVQTVPGYNRATSKLLSHMLDMQGEALSGLQKEISYYV